MKKINMQIILMWVFAVLPSVVMTVFYNMLPSKVIIHIGITGSLRYGDKKVLLILPLISILLAILVMLKDNGSKKVNEFSNEYYAVGLAIMIFMFGMLVIAILRNLGINIFPIQNVMIFCVAILLAVIGNIMKSSSNVMFMNKWTKRDYEVLKRTQKFSGRFIIITSLILAIGTIFVTNFKLFIVTIGVLVLNLLIPNIMSYIWYKERHKK